MKLAVLQGPWALSAELRWSITLVATVILEENRLRRALNNSCGGEPGPATAEILRLKPE